MENFHWETPIPEQHHVSNFDVRKVRGSRTQKGSRTSSCYLRAAIFCCCMARPFTCGRFLLFLVAQT